MPTFRAVATAAYCPRKLYYRRQADGTGRAPSRVERRRALAFEYEELLAKPDSMLREAPIAVTPTQFRARLHGLRERLAVWPALVDPATRNRRLDGQDCRGVVHKVLETEPPTPTLVYTGAPPSRGVWHPQRVRAVAAATALAGERQTPVERAFAEYPAHGIVRPVPLDPRRTAEYRRALATVRAMDGPPPRVDNQAKCVACEYADECGVRTRSFQSKR